MHLWDVTLRAKFSSSRLSVLVGQRQLPVVILMTGRGLEVMPLEGEKHSRPETVDGRLCESRIVRLVIATSQKSQSRDLHRVDVDGPETTPHPALPHEFLSLEEMRARTLDNS